MTKKFGFIEFFDALGQANGEVFDVYRRAQSAGLLGDELSEKIDCARNDLIAAQQLIRKLGNIAVHRPWWKTQAKLDLKGVLNEMGFCIRELDRLRDGAVNEKEEARLLAVIVELINVHRDAGFRCAEPLEPIFCDEDYWETLGDRYEDFFKKRPWR